MPTEPLRYEHYEIQTDDSGSPLSLGAGGMGTTYRAFDTRLKRVVALKIINNSLLATQESKRRFLNEARAAALLDHPAIARVFHVSDETAQECFFTMELVEGESLGSRVARYGPLSAGEALLTLRPIAEALGALAERSLVHRDLKPDNIMLVRTGGGGARVKLIDFGLAKSLDDGSAQHFQSVNTGERFIGSVYFASPEQIRPRKGTSMDARSDFYSLGATLWAVLSGFPPFTGTVFEVQEGHVYNDPPWEKISPLPLPLRQLLTRLLAKAPADRPADAADLLAEWDAAIEGMRAYPAQAPLVPEPVVMEEEGTVLHEGGNETPQPEVAAIVESEPPFVKSTPAPSVAPIPMPAPRPPKKARSPALAFIALILIAAAALAGWWFGIEQPRQQATKGAGSIENIAPENLSSTSQATTPQSNLSERKTSLFGILEAGAMAEKYGRLEEAKSQYEKAQAIDGASSAAKSGIQRVEAAANDLTARGRADIRKGEYTTALPLLKRASDLGDGEAKLALGGMYKKGRGVTKDIGTANDLFAQARVWAEPRSKVGNASAQFVMGFILRDGIGCEKDEKTAFEWWLKSAEQGYSRAQIGVGSMYEHGKGIQKNEAISYEWYRKAVEQANPQAQTFLARNYLNGVGVEKNTDEGIKLLQNATEQGDINAEGVLGQICLTGFVVPKDEKRGIDLIRNAAEKGDEEGQYYLGWAYENGMGVLEDDLRAIEWYKKSADAEFSFGQIALGYMYEIGKGVTKDEKIAGEWYRKAAEQGDRAGQRALGILYQIGKGITKDEKIAAEWYLKAAAQGDAIAQMKLGFMNVNGLGGMTKDPKMAFLWYQKAADQGEKFAQNNLANMYLEGNGVPQNNKLAVELLTKAAKQNLAVAQQQLGFLYRDGVRVEKSWDIALEWFQKAAEQGDAASMVEIGSHYYFLANETASKNERDSNGKLAFSWFTKASASDPEKKFVPTAEHALGLCYIKGVGVLEDTNKSYKLFEKAAAAGNRAAMYEVAKQLADGHGVVKDALSAFNWNKKAAELGYSLSMFALGEHYYSGIGVKRDLMKAAEWYEKTLTTKDPSITPHAAAALAFFYWPYGADDSNKECNRAVNGSNPQKCFNLYKEAAEKGNASGMYSLGLCYAQGVGTAKDNKQAREWYSKAAAKGNESAKKALKK